MYTKTANKVVKFKHTTIYKTDFEYSGGNGM